MPNMFEYAVKWNRNQLLAFASDSVRITSKTLAFTTPAIVAKSMFEDADGNGRRVDMFLIDFIISAELGYVPKKGDAIEYKGAIYIVRPYGKEIWRYDDPYLTSIRIHTQYDREAIGDNE